MTQMRYHKFLRHSAYRRYGIFIISILFSLYSIQVYVNNIGIDEQITQVKKDIINLEEERAFMEKFYKGYLLSEYARYFLGHENGTIYPEEKIVRLSYQVPTKEDEAQLPQLTQKAPITVSTPQEARNHFIETRLIFLQKRGLIK
jgi:hypothetical protein